MNFSLKPSIFLVLLLLIANRSWAQSSENKSGIYQGGVNAWTGFVIRHAPSVGRVAQTHPRGIEINFIKKTTGSQPWHHIYKFPEINYTIGICDYQSNILGYTIHAINSLDKPLIAKKKSTLRLKIGSGVGYNTNPYDINTNFQNIALGSRLMFALQGELSMSYRIIDHLQFRTGLGIYHYSNGSYKTPNAGVNIPYFKLGFNYIPQTSQPVSIKEQATILAEKNKISYHFTGSFFMKEMGLPGGKKYPGGVLTFYVNKKINPKSAFNVGVDGFYNTAIKALIKKDPTIDSMQRMPDFKRIGVTVGHELFIGRLSMLTQLGVYVYYPYQSDTFLYQRVGLKYYLSNNMFTGFFLKTHFGQADCVEWSLGIRI